MKDWEQMVTVRRGFVESAERDPRAGRCAATSVPPGRRGAEDGVDGCSFGVGRSILRRLDIDDLPHTDDRVDPHCRRLEFRGPRLRIPGVECQDVHVDVVREVDRHEGEPRS